MIHAVNYEGYLSAYSASYKTTSYHTILWKLR